MENQLTRNSLDSIESDERKRQDPADDGVEFVTFVTEFLDETYPAKTRGMGLLYGENCMILASTVFD